MAASPEDFLLERISQYLTCARVGKPFEMNWYHEVTGVTQGDVAEAMVHVSPGILRTASTGVFLSNYASSEKNNAEDELVKARKASLLLESEEFIARWFEEIAKRLDYLNADPNCVLSPIMLMSMQRSEFISNLFFSYKMEASGKMDTRNRAIIDVGSGGMEVGRRIARATTLKALGFLVDDEAMVADQPWRYFEDNTGLYESFKSVIHQSPRNPRVVYGLEARYQFDRDSQRFVAEDLAEYLRVVTPLDASGPWFLMR